VPLRVVYSLAEIQTGLWPSQEIDWLRYWMAMVIYPSHTIIVLPPPPLRQDVECIWLAEQWVLVNLTF